MKETNFGVYLGHKNIFDAVIKTTLVTKKQEQMEVFIWIDTKHTQVETPLTHKEVNLLISKRRRLAKKIPGVKHILLVVSNRKMQSTDKFVLNDPDTIIISNTNARFTWGVSPTFSELLDLAMK